MESKDPTVELGRAGTLASDATAKPAPQPAPKVSPDAGTLEAPPALLPRPPMAPPAEETLLPTVERARFHSIGEQGRGGMGRVLQAWDHRLGRTVAIKELLSTDPNATPRFVREAVLTARLQHPSIVPVHEAGRWPSGEPFYAMKLVSGQPLSRIILAKQTLDERLALLPVVIAICEAVAYAHSQRVIHRDLKPDNVIVGKFGETVVIDWGLAKPLDGRELPGEAPSPPPSMATSLGAVLGTPGYMAPEQARGEAVDERADVFALGAILFTTLAGQPPFTGDTAKEVVAKTASDAPPLLRVRVPSVPPDLAAIAERAMAPRPEQRYASAEALAADLQRFATGQLVKARRYTRSELLIRWARRNRLPLGVAGAALLALGLVGGVSVARVVRETHRADRERAAAVAAQASEARRVDQLLLAQASQSLEHDPTEALAWLERLRPASPAWREARAVASEAQLRGVALAQLMGHRGPIAGLAFTPDGTRLFSAGEDGLVQRWELKTRAAEVVDRGARRSDLALSGDGARLVVGGGDGALVVIEAAGKRVPTPARRGRHLGELALSGDGRIAAAVEDDAIHLWRLEGRLEGRLDGRLDGTGAATEAQLSARAPVSVSLSRDGARLAFADADGAHASDVARGTAFALAASSFAGARVARLSADGRWLVVAGRHEARAWDLRDGGAPAIITLDATVTRLDFSPDGARVALGLDDGSVRAWEPRGRNVELAHHGEVAVLDVRFAPDGKRLAVARGPIIRLFDDKGTLLRKLRGPPADVLRLAWSADSTLLASGAADGAIRVWRVADGDVSVQRVGAALPDAMTALAADGRWLARVGDGNQILLRDLATATERVLVAPPPKQLLLVNRWLSAQYASDAWCWSVDDPKQRSVRAPGVIADMAIAADGRAIVLASGSAVLLVDSGGGEPRTWTAPSTIVRVAVAADGGRAAADGEHVAADGTRVAADDRRVAADGTRVAADDRRVAAADRRVAAADRRVAADDRRVVADDRRVVADGKRVAADGVRVAVAGADGDVLLLDGHGPPRRLGHAGAVAALGFSGDGAYVVARGRDERSVIVFDLGGGSTRYLEEDPITAWGLVEGEHILLTGSAAGAVRARDLDGGRQWLLSGHRGRVLAVAGRTGGALWSTAEDGTVRGWPPPAPPAAQLGPFLEAETSVRIDDDDRLH